MEAYGRHAQCSVGLACPGFNPGSDGLQELMGAVAVKSVWLVCSGRDKKGVTWKAMTWLAGDRTNSLPPKHLLAAPTGSTGPRAVVSCSCGPEQGFPEEGTNHRFPNHVLLVIASARSVRKLPVCASGMPCMGALYACALGALYAYAMGARQT